VRAAPVSTVALARAGWLRIDGTRRKCRAVYARRDGWRAAHCGHPTALTPWALYDPTGALVLNGNGRAFPDLASVAAFVEDLGAGRVEVLEEVLEGQRRRRASLGYLHGRSAPMVDRRRRRA